MNRSPLSRCIVFLFPALLLLALGGCSTLRIEKPPEFYNNTDVIPEYSNINIPFHYDLKNLETTVNRRFSGLVYSDTSFDNNDKDDLMVKAWRMGDFRISMTGNDLYYKIPLRLWINKRFGISSFGISLSDSKEFTAEIVLKFRTRVTLNKNWTVSTVTFSDGYEWLSTPQLKLGAISIPLPYIADLVVQGNLGLVNREIDKALQSLMDFRQTIQKTWKDIQKPVLIPGEFPVWLKIVPAEVSTIPLKSSSGVIDHTVGIKAAIMMSFGSEPEYTVNESLPDMKITSRLDDSFLVNLPVDVTFDKINEIARQQLSGYTVEQGKYRVAVNDLSVYGNGEDLVVALKVSGTVNGTVYLTGKPWFDRADSTLKIKDLDFDIKTRNVLQKSASWIFHHGLAASIEKKLIYPGGKQIKLIVNEMQSQLKDNHVTDIFTISGAISNLTIRDILITKTSVRVIGILEGKLNIILEMKP